MYYVMSAEDTGDNIEPFFYGSFETEEEARDQVAKIVERLGLEDEDGNPLKPGVNDCERWAETRYDADGLIAWNKDIGISVFAKTMSLEIK